MTAIFLKMLVRESYQSDADVVSLVARDCPKIAEACSAMHKFAVPLVRYFRGIQNLWGTVFLYRFVCIAWFWVAFGICCLVLAVFIQSINS